MYNWPNDHPIGSKQSFLNVIKYFNQNNRKVLSGQKICVLEIGTYTGVSLINIINMIPNSDGIGVDKWCSYTRDNLSENIETLEVKKSFYKNINKFGLQYRITGLNDDSTSALINFIQNKKVFDFIYIDGSKLLLDCYNDLVLAWHILERDGIIVINDYLYKKDSILEGPIEGVKHFLETYQGKYKILDKNYSVFLQKL
jgi:predicted O-methyltransferase YrrM